MADTIDTRASDTSPEVHASLPKTVFGPRPAEPAHTEPAQVEPAQAGLPTSPSTVGLALWRCLDITVSVVALIVMSPLMLIVAALVKASGPGPIIFRQTRVGRGGNEFELWKFRTMQDGTHQLVMSDPDIRADYEKNDFKLSEDDPHITPIGRKLRKSSLDELPQLLNVIKGQMSLVGVRPLLPQELARRAPYDRSLYMRHRPGVTGLWQVEGRSSVKAAERIELDRTYLEHWSFWTNLKLALQTPRAVLFGHGAH
jgi:lipopolysaccharide/colanic/teichoic acid biosynthesis glycosyltransferase